MGTEHALESLNGPFRAAVAALFYCRIFCPPPIHRSMMILDKVSNLPSMREHLDIFVRFLFLFSVVFFSSLPYFGQTASRRAISDDFIFTSSVIKSIYTDKRYFKLSIFFSISAVIKTTRGPLSHRQICQPDVHEGWLSDRIRLWSTSRSITSFAHRAAAGGRGFHSKGFITFARQSTVRKQLTLYRSYYRMRALRRGKLVKIK